MVVVVVVVVLVVVVEVVVGSSVEMVVVTVSSIVVVDSLVSIVLGWMIGWFLGLVESSFLEVAMAITTTKMTTKVMIIAKERPIKVLLGMLSLQD